MTSRRLVIAGGTGFLGQLLARWFDRPGWNVAILARHPVQAPTSGRAIVWDGRSIGDWAAELDGAHALINLAGRSVNCRYHARNRSAILRSRVESTRVLGEAIARCSHPPRVWLNSSTATIYKHSHDRAMDELSGIIEGTPAAKDLFSIEVAKAWEKALAEAATPHTRKLALRTAMVFSTTPGTVYRVLRRLVRFGLGGPMAGGRQYVSWLHETDFCRAVEWLIQLEDLDGAVNLAAPHPVTNREMMQTIRRVLHTPVGLPASRWMLEVGTFLMRSETELVIKSRRVIPTRLTIAGFDFEFPELAPAIEDLERKLASSRHARAHRVA